jgi:hypothetical protein
MTEDQEIRILLAIVAAIERLPKATRPGQRPAEGLNMLITLPGEGDIVTEETANTLREHHQETFDKELIAKAGYKSGWLVGDTDDQVVHLFGAKTAEGMKRG